MRHHRTRRRIKRGFSHRKQMLENLVVSLFRYQQIRTTWVKAKEAQRLADRLITLGKANSLHAKRRAFSILGDRAMTVELFGKIAPRFSARRGGYTRVLHLATRKGDAAPIALLELTEKEVREPKIKPKTAKAARAGVKETESPAAEKKTGAAAPESHAKHAKESLQKEFREKPGLLRNISQFFRRKGGAA